MASSAQFILEMIALVTLRGHGIALQATGVTQDLRPGFLGGRRDNSGSSGYSFFGTAFRDTLLPERYYISPSRGSAIFFILFPFLDEPLRVRF